MLIPLGERDGATSRASASVRMSSLPKVASNTVERPFRVVSSPGHTDRFGECVPDKWAVIRSADGRIVQLFPTEPEAREFVSERNAEQLLSDTPATKPNG